MIIDMCKINYAAEEIILHRQTIPEAGFLLKVAEKVQKMAKWLKLSENVVVE